MATVIDSLLVRLGFDADTSSLNIFETRLSGLIEKTDQFNNDMSGLRNAALAAGAAIGAVMYKAASAAMEFESAMADVNKVVDFDTPDGLTKMREELLELSTQIPITAEGFAQIAAAAGQSGIAAGEITEFATAAAKMGIAFDISADEAGQAMAEMRVAFKMTQDDVGGLVDKINYLGDSTPNTAAAILQVVQRIGSLGEIAGISADQLAAMAASTTSLAPEIVSTGLKNMMINLTKGTSATEAQEVAFLELGFTAQEVASGMQKDSQKMIGGVLDAIKGVDADKQAAIINTIFGAEALPVVAQLITNGEMLEANLNAIGDASLYAGSAQKEFETRSATTANQIELLKNNLNVAAITVGDILLPAINQIVTALIPLIQQFADWAKENPELIKQILMISGAIIGAILAVSGMGLAFSGVLSVLKGVGTALGLLFSPIAWVVAALAGLAFVIYDVYNYLNGKDSIIGSLIKDYPQLQYVITAVVGLVDALKRLWTDNQAGIMQLFDSIVGLYHAFEPVLNMVIAVLPYAFQALLTAVTMIINTISMVLQGWVLIFAGVVNAIALIWNVFWGAASAIVSTTISVISSIINTVVAVFSSVVATISGLWSGLWAGIKSAAAAAIDFVIGKVQALIGMVSGVLGTIAKIGNFKMPSFSGAGAAMGGGKNGGGGGSNTSNVNQTFNVASPKDASNIAGNSVEAQRKKNNGYK